MNSESRNSESGGYGSRLKEMTAVLKKHGITRGVTPEKLRLILEDLGPTYIKLGQIMSLHSDILPKKYCEELIHLHSEVTPMPFEQVKEVIEEAYGFGWDEVFADIEEEPLGSASIAQVHRAVLKSGEQVVVKVQRKGIYEIMARDIGLLHKAVKLVPSATLKDMVDLDMVLDELWMVAQEEMNFLAEAANMEEFAKKPVNKLSGGQKQRVAIARAIVNEPELILADEPTGALDTKTSAEIMAVFRKLNESGKTVVIVTHDLKIAEQCSRIVEISDGKIVL